MVLLLYDKEKYGGNQVIIYWVINILTRILLITRAMGTTVIGSIITYWIIKIEYWIRKMNTTSNQIRERTLLLMENKVNVRFIMKQ